jgi:phosphohistidine phosphatase SixA
MTTEILLRMHRHSIKGQEPFRDVLSSDGFDLAREIGERELRHLQFTHAVMSDAFRTCQTLAAMSEGAKDWAIPEFRAEAGLAGPDLDRLSRLIDRLGSKQLEHLMRVEPRFIRHYCHSLKHTLHRILRSMNLKSFAHIILIGHAPMIEMIVYELTREMLVSLRECEGAVLSLELSRWSLTGKLHFEFRRPYP